MERSRQKKLVEAILFLKEDPVRLEKIAEILEAPREEALEIVAALRQDLAGSGRGIRIFEVAGGYQMGTAPELASDLERAFGEDDDGSLSNAALETMAIIAYKQPVTRIEIESIRGVRCEHTLESLLKRRLIKVSGRKEGPGRPLIYCTTTDFLKYFGLKELKDLPVLDNE